MEIGKMKIERAEARSMAQIPWSADDINSDTFA